MTAPLSQTLPFRDHADCCQECGLTEYGGKTLFYWQECDEQDKPTAVAIRLCEQCENELIPGHERLYVEIQSGQPFPGVMPVCADCRFRQVHRCTSPLLKANGGPGLPLNFPQPVPVHIDRTVKGRRVGVWAKMWKGPVICRGKEAQP